MAPGSERERVLDEQLHNFEVDMREYRERMVEAGKESLAPDPREETNRLREELSGLLESSPAGPRGRVARVEENREERPKRYLEQWELRGMLGRPDSALYSLHNPWEGVGFWAAVGEKRHGLEIAGFDRESGTLEVRHEGDFRELTLRSGSLADAHEEVLRKPSGNRSDPAPDEFYAKWRKAAEMMPKLDKIEADLREWGKVYWKGERAMHELRRLSLAAGDALRNHPEFSEQEADFAERAFVNPRAFVGDPTDPVDDDMTIFKNRD